ncbi:hypothetical protein [Salinibaculum rarum]|uniref:hypothetical protein n=1 Tax=Salinibaculum rarum TaxID=3058903 RepID=UPI0026602EDA|nr:hypothetical protein [Salinibaculum sp. KK48]
MSVPDEFEPILQVEWGAVQNPPPQQVQNAVEYYGTSHAGKYDPASVPDEWHPGGNRWGQLRRLLDKHAAFNVPGHGPLDSTYVGLTNATGLEFALQAYRGDDDVDLQFPVLVPLDPAAVSGVTSPAAVQGAGLKIDAEAVDATTPPSDHEYSYDNTDFGAEVHALATAAQTLDARVSEFNDPAPGRDSITGHPRVHLGQYGPDALGNLYISCFVPEDITSADLPIDDLPVEVENLRYDEPEPGVDVTLRHERYTGIPWATEPWGERTHAVFEQLKQQAAFRGVAELRYVPDEDEFTATIEEHFGVEQTEQTLRLSDEAPITNWVVYRILNQTDDVSASPASTSFTDDAAWVVVPTAEETTESVLAVAFQTPPTVDSLRTALAVVEARSTFRRGDGEAVYECASCDEWAHWLGAETTPGPDTVSRRLAFARAGECGCSWAP